MNKHTPGPWKVQTEISGRGYLVEMVGHNSDGEPKFNAMVEAPAYFVCGVGGIGKAECLANARLIAAAPEMAEFLKVVERGACLQQFNGDKCICYPCTARALLAKIGGGE